MLIRRGSSERRQDRPTTGARTDRQSQLTTVLDRSALEHVTVLVSGGRRGLDVELAPADLVALLGARGASICRSR